MDARDLVDQLARLRRFDLAQSWRAGMPRYPTHQPYMYTLTKLHGDSVREGGASSASDAIALGTHVGTHIDALCHYSRDGRVYGGAEVAGLQEWTRGIARHGVETIGLVMRRGVLLDVAKLLDSAEGVVLPEDAEIDGATLARAEEAAGERVKKDDVVLVRTGWGRYWSEPARFVNGMKLPGVTLDGARWLSERGVFAAGSDTVAFERTPSASMEVHVHLLVECGIHIIECLQLEELSAAGIGEFLVVATPLKLDGATASPLRPFALA